MECKLVTLTQEERQRRYEKAVAKNAESRRIRALRAANREARLREKNVV
jgi:hypothetical protein